MSVLSKRTLLLVTATLVIAIGGFAAIWGVPKFLKRSTSINGQVTAYLLDDRGAVNGLLLANGDQLHFSPQTGVAVATQIKIGDQVTAVGHAGSQSSYGREVRVEQISANGRTIVEADAGPPRKHEPSDHHGPDDRRGRGDREGRPGPPEPVGTEATEPNRTSENDPKSKPTENAAPVPTPSTASSPAPTPEIFRATGTVRTHLVNGHGDVDGLILSSGEQLRFSPKVGELVVAAEQGPGTQVSVEGTGVRNQSGTLIRPMQITVGNKTITLSH